jgi:hypothetical protein
MGKHDYQTSTVDGARAHAERHAEPDYDDDRPTKEDCEREEAQERWLDEELPAIIDTLEDISARLNDAGKEDWADLLDSFICTL